MSSQDLSKQISQMVQPLVEELESIALRIEYDPNDLEIVTGMTRILKSIEMISSFSNSSFLKDLTSHFQQFVQYLYQNSLRIQQSDLETIFRGVDLLKDHFRTTTGEKRSVEHPSSHEIESYFKVEKSNANGESSQGRSRTRGHDQSNEKITIPISVLDQFLEVTGKLTIIRRMIKSKADTLKRRYMKDKDVIALIEIIDEMQKENQHLQNRSESLRKIPLQFVFNPIKRNLRKATQNNNKKIHLSLIGEELLIDRKLSKILSTCLDPIIFNSIEHGIEFPEERKRSGKDEVGHIKISGQIRDDRMFIEIIDDGKGLDLQHIKTKAVERGFLSRSQIDGLDEHKIANLIFESQLSNSKETDQENLTQYQMALSQVKQELEYLGGHIEVHETSKKGTTFRLEIPLPKSFLVLQAIYARCNGHSFAIPRDEVSAVLDLQSMKKQKRVQDIEGEDVLSYQDQNIPLIDLKKIFPKPNTRKGSVESQDVSIVIVGNDVVTFGMIVDQVLSLEEIVIKEMDGYVKNNNIFSKATLIGDEGLSPVLDLDCFTRVIKEKKLRTRRQILSA